MKRNTADIRLEAIELARKRLLDAHAKKDAAQKNVHKAEASYIKVASPFQAQSLIKTRQHVHQSNNLLRTRIEYLQVENISAFRPHAGTLGWIASCRVVRADGALIVKRGYTQRTIRHVKEGDLFKVIKK